MANRRQAPSFCSYCKAEFHAWRTNQPYCSHECAGKARLGVDVNRKSLDKSWMASANCLDVNPSLFFPEVPDDDDGRETIAHQTAQAKQVCAGCEVQAACLQYAIATGETWGIWGGLTAGERARMRWRERKAKARSSKLGDVNAGKKTCPQGHTYDDAYMYVSADGYMRRECRRCQLERLERIRRTPA